MVSKELLEAFSLVMGLAKKQKRAFRSALIVLGCFWIGFSNKLKMT
jgi:hypothetical protein